MSRKTFKIEWAPTAVGMLGKIADKRVQRKIFERALALETDPDSQGKALIGPLTGYRCVRAVGQRYRIVYRVERDRVIVIILAVGLRKAGDRADIYTLAKKLVRLGLLGK